MFTKLVENLQGKQCKVPSCIEWMESVVQNTFYDVKCYLYHSITFYL